MKRYNFGHSLDCIDRSTVVASEDTPMLDNEKDEYTFIDLFNVLDGKLSDDETSLVSPIETVREPSDLPASVPSTPKDKAATLTQVGNTSRRNRWTILGKPKNFERHTVLFDEMLSPSRPSVETYFFVQGTRTLIQLGIVFIIILVHTYEMVFRRRVRRIEFDIGGVCLFQSGAGILFGLLLTCCTRTYQAFAPLQKVSLIKQVSVLILNYAPVGFAFTLAQILGIQALRYIPAHIHNIVDQTRLVIFVLLRFVFVRKRQTKSQVVSLAVVLAGIALHTTVSFRSDPREYALGLGYTFGAVLISVSAVVYCENSLKEVFRTQPPFVRKIYIEICGGLTALAFSGFVYLAIPSTKISMFRDEFFTNWKNWQMISFVSLFCLKSWFIGFSRHVDNPIVATAQYTTVALLYFAEKLHDCPGNEFYSFQGLQDVTSLEVGTTLLVVISIAAYVLVGVENRKHEFVKKNLEQMFR